ncbi:MAG: D-aminoacylase domain protein [Gemmatimonadetes bacterium]|nr:D-aminoacylase domain protein [Gemmatimonadota bacterium]
MLKLLVLTALLSAQAAGAQRTPRYDLVITGGTVVDGTGARRYRADVAIADGRIVTISRKPIAPASARRVIDARGRVVSPGFIDLHAHLEPLPELSGARSAVTQGVTTALGGPDGSSPWPFGPYLAERARQGIGINVAYLVGHNTVRHAVMGDANRAPTADELARMQGMIAQAMGEGAFGISTGLKYIPGTYSTIDEVVALSQLAADSGGIYTSHLREEGLGLLGGVGEAIEIGRRAHIPIVLTHHKAVGRKMWGKSVVTLRMLDSARRAGTDVMADVYPYTATHTGISVLIPSWALADGDTAFARRIATPALKDSITRGIVFNILNDRGGGDLRRVQFSRVSWDKTLEGKTLADWATRRHLALTPENGAALVIEAQLAGGANAIYHVLDEGDVRRIMRHPMTMIASDGRLSSPGDGHPHPRAYGTFPRVLGRYVREYHVLTLEQAVHKMTGMPAARLGLGDRGVLREGAAADLVVFDAATIVDRATFESPHQYTTGIDYVLVNGVPAIDRGTFTDSRTGVVLKRTAGKK